MLARQALYHLSHSTSPCAGYFWNRVSQTVCPGWLWTTILLIPAFQVARITGVSHQCLASIPSFCPSHLMFNHLLFKTYMNNLFFNYHIFYTIPFSPWNYIFIILLIFMEAPQKAKNRTTYYMIQKYHS
jgi:hypothetical protein